ncbi:MAG: class I SAM-dependent methyltransferase [Patescibacteria group bacterium]
MTADSYNTTPDGYWSGHYNTLDGPAKVAAREALYFCLGNGIEPIDFNLLAADTVRTLGILARDPIVDVGCGGRLKYLHELQRRGHTHLIGVEPNTQQLGGAPFWQPLEPSSILENIIKVGDQAQIDAFYEQFRRNLRFTNVKGIKVIESDANYIPLPTGAAKVVSKLFSAYAIDEDKQQAAFEESARILAPDGIMLVGLSNADNKSTMREQESKIAEACSMIIEDQTGERVEVKPPTPINAGLTLERGIKRLRRIYRHLWLYAHADTIVIDTPDRALKWEASHDTTMDLYRVVEGSNTRPLTRAEYRLGYMAVVGKKLDEAGIQPDGKGGRIEDQLRRGLILASNQYIEVVPRGFEYHDLAA